MYKKGHCIIPFTVSREPWRASIITFKVGTVFCHGPENNPTRGVGEMEGWQRVGVGLGQSKLPRCWHKMRRNPRGLGSSQMRMHVQVPVGENSSVCRIIYVTWRAILTYIRCTQSPPSALTTAGIAGAGSLFGTLSSFPLLFQHD